MNRRQLLAASAAALLIPAVSRADDAKRRDYSRELYEKSLASGEPFLLDFTADW